MPIEKKIFGVLGTGNEVSLFVLRAGEFTITMCDYGAILISFLVPDGRGGLDDILLGFSTLSGYATKHPYFGATVGRFANRIGAARFTLGEKEYRLASNNGENHLHGGIKGFDKFIWNAEAFEKNGVPTILFTRSSPDGEEGYPGKLDVCAEYSLDKNGSLHIAFEARTSARTIVNLTNHAYFNLKGEGRGTILDHEIELACSRYVPVGTNLIPTGSLENAAGGPFDFRRKKRIGRDIEVAGGYDHCYAIDRNGAGLVKFADVSEPVTGRRMSVSSTLPGVQFYTGNSLPTIPGKRGSLYDKHSGFCLETEYFPDSPNQPSFPSSILEPGAIWSHETVYTVIP